MSVGLYIASQKGQRRFLNWDLQGIRPSPMARLGLKQKMGNLKQKMHRDCIVRDLNGKKHRVMSILYRFVCIIREQGWQ